jgi:hypothetical protein
MISQVAGGDTAIPLLLQLGIAAPFVWGMYQAYKREVKRADRLEEEVKRLNDVNQDRTLPALIATASSLKEVADLNSDVKLQVEIERRVSSILKERGEGER